MKNISFFVLILFLYSCGYTSIYKNQELQNYKFEIVKMDGDKKMNNLIKSEIELYSNKLSKNIYKLVINTDFKKEILTTNSSGDVTDYKLSITSKFKISYEENTQLLEFNESINIKNLADRFEQDTYEKNIKINFASSIREKLMSKMFNLHDN